MYSSIGTIIATIFAASVSHVYSDLTLESRINAFNATVVDDRGNSMLIEGEFLNIQIVYFKDPSGKYPPSGNYGDIDWIVKAQSSDGKDMAIYDFSLSDDSDQSSSADRSPLGNLLRGVPPPIPIMVPEIGSAESPSSEDSAQLPLLAVPSQISEIFPPALQRGPTTTRVGATTTEANFPATPFPRGGNNLLVQPSPRSAYNGSSRVKRNAQGDQGKATFDNTGVSPSPDHVANTAVNSSASNIANTAANIPNNVDTNQTMSNSATNGTTVSYAPISNNASETKNNKTTTTANTGSGVTMVISSWMAILIPLFVIICTTVE